MVIRVILCDDQEIVTEGMQLILRSASGIEVVGIAHDGVQAVEFVEKLNPDLVLMDLRMPIMNGIQATRQIRQQFPNTKILVLTTYDDDEWVFDAVRAGAAGYLLKDAPRDQIINAIQSQGMTVVPIAVGIERGLVKVEIGIGRGKKRYDKRETIKKRDMLRDAGRDIRSKDK